MSELDNALSRIRTAAKQGGGGPNSYVSTLRGDLTITLDALERLRETQVIPGPFTADIT